MGSSTRSWTKMPPWVKVRLQSWIWNCHQFDVSDKISNLLPEAKSACTRPAPKIWSVPKIADFKIVIENQQEVPVYKLREHLTFPRPLVIPWEGPPSHHSPQLCQNVQGDESCSFYCPELWILWVLSVLPSYSGQNVAGKPSKICGYFHDWLYELP